MTLLQTKLFIPPARPGLVSRSRLVERLTAGLGRKLSLISAPAGFGKTTLLIEWAHTCGRPVAWVSLDEGDNDPGRFWAYVVAALETLPAEFGEATLAPLRASEPLPVEAMLAALINEIATIPQDFLLILDDYHLIETPAIHDALTFLLDHLPPQIHLGIASRVDPHLPLVQLRARGQLTELRYDDLRFTLAEVSAFLNETMGLNLTPGELDALESRTEGWIVGLQLAALSLQGRTDASDFIAAFTGSHHYILEYLTEEVLARQAEPVRRFLLQTSILDRLCGSLCDFVTGLEPTVQPGDAQAATARPSPPSAGLRGQEMLRQLEQANLFLIPLDDQRLWYRYHRLFADLLRKQLRQQTTAQQVAALQQRASAWHECEGSLDEAVLYALQAGEYECVLRLVEEAAAAGRLDSRLSTMLHWLEGVPEELLVRRTRLRIYQAWALVINEQLHLAQQVLHQSFHALQSMTPSPETAAMRDELDTLLSIVDMMASALASAYGGDNLEETFQAALAVREKASAAGNVFLTGHATNGLAMARFHQGRLGEAAEYYQQLVDLGLQGQTSQLPLAAVGHIGLAAISLERNELDAARRHLDKGRQLSQHRVGTNTLVSAAITQSRLRDYVGDREGAFQALDDAERLDPVRDSTPAIHRLARQRACLHLSGGDLDGAEHLVRRLDGLFGRATSGEAVPPAFLEAQQLVLARLHLLRDEPGAALDLLHPIHQSAKAADRLGRVIEISLLEALAWQALGEQAAALTALEESMALAEGEGYLRVYLDEGTRLLPLLSALDHDPRASRPVQRYGQKVRNLLDVNAGGRQPGPEDASAALTEPLTRRERLVLDLMLAGLPGPEIAEELVVAYSTVRSHIKSIYGKLGAHSRHEAIERAKALKLI